MSIDNIKIILPKKVRLGNIDCKSGLADFFAFREGGQLCQEICRQFCVEQKIGICDAKKTEEVENDCMGR